VNKELIVKLIEKAKAAADNAYCPYTNLPIGCALLAEENLIFSGCNIEFAERANSRSAGEVALFMAMSQGYMRFTTVCFYSAERMPYPSGVVLQMLSEFNTMIKIIVATDENFSVYSLYELLPFPYEAPPIE
jgi:cytidine deaminase